jgi:hypothetical protein
MNQLASGALAAALVALLLAACDEGDATFATGTGGSGLTNCDPYASCETCTPVLGCGWCYAADGTGTCAPEPRQCESAGSTWTWDLNGCRVGAVPAVAQEDASPSIGVSDSATEGGNATVADGDALDGNALDGNGVDSNALDSNALDSNALDSNALDGNALDSNALDVDGSNPR